MARMTNLSSFLLAGLFCLSAQAESDAAAVEVQTASFDELIQYCKQHPEFIVGGAATGACLGQLANELEPYLAEQSEALFVDQCPAVKAAWDRAQEQAVSYQQSLCGLFPAMHDNTAMYINQQACHLRVGLARRDDLAFIARYKPEQSLPCD